jgi:hypothetical protein
MKGLKEKIKNTLLLTENEKKLVLFVMEKQFVTGECVVTNSDLIDELEISSYQLKKITKSLNSTDFFKSSGDKAGVGQYRPHVGYFKFRNIGNNKRIILNELLLKKFLDEEKNG